MTQPDRFSAPPTPVPLMPVLRIPAPPMLASQMPTPLTLAHTATQVAPMAAMAASAWQQACRQGTRPAPARPWAAPLALGLLAAALMATWPGAARAADEPVDVPITRGKVDLGLKPNLVPSGGGAAAAPAGTKPADPGAAAPGAAPATRPKPRTVADYAAEAKAKAAAEAAGQGAAAPPAAPVPAPAPAAPVAPAAQATPGATPHTAPTAPQVAAPTAAPTAAAAHSAPADKAPDKAASKPVVKPAAKPPARPAAPAKAPDDGLDKVAVKLVEAMARASAKQDKREAAARPASTGSTTKKSAEPRTATPAAHGGGHAHDSAHWTYEGDTGPENWAKLKPDFNICAIGQRQSPIAINDSATLQGPAEPIGFAYQASEGSVVNNGHTIQVDLTPANSITVRSGVYQLLQFHFHHPSEEQVNGKRYDMVAHLVHKNADGQLAVVAVLLTPGEANPAVETVWKHMPLDTGDRVKLPADALQVADLLPKDQRYYQFMGSLTTPPCTEGVLWMVLKTPVTLSPAQIRLFGQLFPHNARPVQELNGRPVREGL